MGEFDKIWDFGFVVGVEIYCQIPTRTGDAAVTVQRSVAVGQIWHFKFPPLFPQKPRAPCNVGASADQGSADIFVFGPGAILVNVHFAMHQEMEQVALSQPPFVCKCKLCSAVGPVVYCSN